MVIIPPTAGFSSTNILMLATEIETSGLTPNEEQVTTYYDLPDLTIELNITSELMHWRVRTKIHNTGTATISAGTAIVWKLAENEESIVWVKVIPYSPFEPNTSISGLPESNKLEFNKLRWRDHEITAIVDPPYEDDYPWEELNPDPIYGLIIESNEDNNFDSYTFPKIFSFSITKTINNYFEPVSALENNIDDKESQMSYIVVKSHVET
jgi:hypothetical protein